MVNWEKTQTREERSTGDTKQKNKRKRKRLVGTHIEMKAQKAPPKTKNQDGKDEKKTTTIFTMTRMRKLGRRHLPREGALVHVAGPVVL